MIIEPFNIPVNPIFVCAFKRQWPKQVSVPDILYFRLRSGLRFPFRLGLQFRLLFRSGIHFRGDVRLGFRFCGSFGNATRNGKPDSPKIGNVSGNGKPGTHQKRKARDNTMRSPSVSCPVRAGFDFGVAGCSVCSSKFNFWGAGCFVPASVLLFCGCTVFRSRFRFGQAERKRNR